ncbi:hypothetical protein C0993_000835 [Termitomyces sp. T159_Od127]|nr:hypothetical protein C0993_000835 [Termitomyces sp. T159_Od127]
MEKALQSSPSKKTSTITRVYPAVKEESVTPIKSVAGGLPDLADSPLSVSDSDDDDLPVVPRIYKQSSTKSSSGINSSFVDVEAACEDDDQPLEPPGNDLSDNLSDFVVPDDAPVQYVSSDDDAVDASNNDEDYIAANEDEIAVDDDEIATNAELELSVPLIDINAYVPLMCIDSWFIQTVVY